MLRCSYNRQVPRIVGDGAKTRSAEPAGRAALHPVTRDWFAGRFRSPSPAQEEAWPRILAGKSTLISAPTGSGKTLAAFLCAIDRLVFDSVPPPPQTGARSRPGRSSPGVRVLYISPVKALARDVDRNLQEPLASICALATERGVPHAVSYTHLTLPTIYSV